MKKMLTLLAVAMIPATLSGCAACCPTGFCGLGSLCPCCPFNRGAPCPPAPTYAPVSACPPAPAPCAVWDPCQCAVVSQPRAGAFAAPPAFSQAAPTYMQAPPTYMQAPPAFAQTQPQVMPQMMPTQPMYFAEPNCGCGYAEATCGAPYMGAVGYGGMPMEYAMPGGACCGAGEVVGPTPEGFVDPRPMAE